MDGDAPERAKGFILVLVVDAAQTGDEHDAIARVCRDYEVGTVYDLQREVLRAAAQAGNQLMLRQAAQDVFRRVRLRERARQARLN